MRPLLISADFGQVLIMIELTTHDNGIYNFFAVSDGVWWALFDC